MDVFLNITITDYKIVPTQAGQEMVFCNSIENGSKIELIFFPNTNETIKKILSHEFKKTPITVYGEKRVQNNQIQIIVERLELPTS